LGQSRVRRLAPFRAGAFRVSTGGVKRTPAPSCAALGLLATLLLAAPPCRAGTDAVSHPATTAAAPEAPDAKGAPLPLHTLEGSGGVLLTEIAYIVNPAPKGHLLGDPAASLTYVGAGAKSIQDVALTEAVGNRVEVGFAASRFDTGSFRRNVNTTTGLPLGQSDVYLYVLGVRGVVVEENSFDLPLPAITLGVQGKYNDGIATINRELGHALNGIGYHGDTGVDFVATATKAFPKVFDRTLLLSAGLRLSKASQIGYTGFGGAYHPTFEGNFAYGLTPWLWLAAEYRQKADPYGGEVGRLVRKENDWADVGLAFVPNNRLTITVGYGYFGNLLDTSEKAGYAVQTKYEF